METLGQSKDRRLRAKRWAGLKTGGYVRNTEAGLKAGGYVVAVTLWRLRSGGYDTRLTRTASRLTTGSSPTTAAVW